ncbi:hypothetical protein [Mammaliicoccus sciuri]|uniref:hypothetical protein n=1 Tax=Mammaliicoccus sciuri TaxID=1296 RepID=UPI002DB896D4|nr:hypothetical protein [Mammaliicoccus sciuri]MEB8265369.1 hypothetical protein [Mammaliicoccus sciuri]
MERINQLLEWATGQSESVGLKIVAAVAIILLIIALISTMVSLGLGKIKAAGISALIFIGVAIFAAGGYTVLKWLAGGVSDEIGDQVGLINFVIQTII